MISKERVMAALVWQFPEHWICDTLSKERRVKLIVCFDFAQHTDRAVKLKMAIVPKSILLWITT